MMPDVLRPDFTKVFLLNKTVDDDEEWQAVEYG